VSYPATRKPRTNFPVGACDYCGREMPVCSLPKHQRTHRLPYVRLLPTADEQGAMVKAYQHGQSLAQIAATMFWSTTEVRRVLLLNDVTLRNVGSAHRKISPEQVAERVRLYASGLSLEEVAAACGVTREAVRHTLRRAGVTVRRRGPNRRWERQAPVSEAAAAPDGAPLAEQLARPRKARRVPPRAPQTLPEASS
jgi:DNA-binding CsgD family transcriptional regulator